jgi:hypothetical protein
MQPWNQKPGWEANTPVNQAHLAAFNARPAHQWGFGATPRTPQRPPTPAELAAGKAWAPQLKDFVIPGLGSMNPPQGPQAPGPLAMKTPYGLPSMVPRGAATVPGEAPMGGMKAPYAMPYMVPRGYQADPYEQMQQDVSAAMGAAKKAPYTPTALRGNNYAQSPQGYVVSDPEPRPAARPRLSSPSTRY